MSGTSLDGVDAVLVNLHQKKPELIASYSHPIPPSLKKTLRDMTNPKWQGSFADIGVLTPRIR